MGYYKWGSYKNDFQIIFTGGRGSDKKEYFILSSIKERYCGNERKIVFFFQFDCGMVVIDKKASL